MLIVIDGDDHGPEPFEIDELDDLGRNEGPEGTNSDIQLAEMPSSANPQLERCRDRRPDRTASLAKLLSRFNRRDRQ